MRYSKLSEDEQLVLLGSDQQYLDVVRRITADNAKGIVSNADEIKERSGNRQNNMVAWALNGQGLTALEVQLFELTEKLRWTSDQVKLYFESRYEIDGG